MRPLPRPTRVSLPVTRTAIILAVACIIGAAAGALTYLASRSLLQALLASGTAISGSAHLLGQLLGDVPERLTRSQDNNRDDDQSDGIGQNLKI